MTTTQFVVAAQFADAFAEHFGMPKHALMQRIVIDVQPDSLLAAQVTIMLGADDLAAIAALMQPTKPPVEIKPAGTVWLHGKQLDRVVAFGEDDRGKWVEQELESASEINTTIVHNPDLEFRPAGDAPAEKPDFRPPGARRPLSAQEMIEKGTKITNKRIPL